MNNSVGAYFDTLLNRDVPGLPSSTRLYGFVTGRDADVLGGGGAGAKFSALFPAAAFEQVLADVDDCADFARRRFAYAGDRMDVASRSGYGFAAWGDSRASCF